jgi:hypothetical protein
MTLALRYTSLYAVCPCFAIFSRVSRNPTEDKPFEYARELFLLELELLFFPLLFLLLVDNFEAWEFSLGLLLPPALKRTKLNICIREK